MLSKKSVEMLKWLKELDIFVDESDLPDHAEWEETHYPEQCRINDKGRAYLEERQAAQFDKWVTRSLAIAAFLISFTALLSQLGILRLQ